MSSTSRLLPVTNTKGRDLPVWLLWVNIDYTAVSQLSGATGAEHSHVLWCFFERSNIWPNPSPGPALAPASALLSAAHISMCGSASGSGFSGLLLCVVRPSRRCIWTGSWNLKARVLRQPRGHWLWPMVWQYIWVHMFLAPAFIHVIGLTLPASKKALCWLPLLTSETWPAPWRWALTTE